MPTTGGGGNSLGGVTATLMSSVVTSSPARTSMSSYRSKYLQDKESRESIKEPLKESSNELSKERKDSIDRTAEDVSGAKKASEKLVPHEPKSDGIYLCFFCFSR